MVTTSTAFMQQPDTKSPRWRGTDERISAEPEVMVDMDRYNSIASSVSDQPYSTLDNQPSEPSTTPETEAGNQRTIVKTLVFTRPVIFSDITISNPVSGSQSYHAATTEVKRNTPDVTLHAGGDATGPVLAVSYFRWTRNCKLGVGDPENERDVVWEELKNTSPCYTHGRYEFEFAKQRPGALPAFEDRRRFVWRRTVASTYAVNTWAAWWSRRHYELVDKDSGEVIAVFLANNMNSLTKKGELRFFWHVSKDLEVMIVLTMASISEKATRRARYTRHHGAAGC